MIQAYPESFDLFTASQDDLRVYGIPPRPDPKISPRWHRLWMEMFKNRPQRVVADGAADKRFKPRRLPRRAIQAAGANATMDFWSGSAFGGAPTGVFSTIAAWWVVPNVTVTDESDEVLIWVGIDGWGTNSVLQIGTWQYYRKGQLYTHGWSEWFPGTAGLPIPGFDVKPGDTVAAVVSASSATEAVITITNVTTNKYSSNPVSAPTGLQVQGQTAEWIVERPGQPHDPLANFGQVGFTLAAADYVDQLGGTVQGELHAENGTLIDMVNRAGVLLASSQVGSTNVGFPAVAVTFANRGQAGQ
jgi:hypothetical protein